MSFDLIKDEQFEIGRMYASLGKISEAIEKLTLASEFYKKEKNMDQYLKVQNMLIRIFAEQLNFDQVNRIKEELQDFVLKDELELTSRTYYTLGICAAYKQQVDLAFDYFQKALALAVNKDLKEDMCYAINGLAMCYMHMGRLSEATEEIKKLQVFFEVIDLPILKISTQIVSAYILSKQEKHDKALDILWVCYESLKNEVNIAMFNNVLFAIGKVYFESGNHEMAKLYLQLAKKSTHPENFKQSLILIDALLNKMGVSSNTEFDLVINSVDHTVTEKRIGKVDFKNQFILLELLNLFVKNPGKNFSKEELVKSIWSQEYNPGVHDNKVYVTIKRLRKLIEPDLDKPSYIYRSKNGYYMSQSAKVLIEKGN